jgi:hypothetical protein
MCVLNTLKSISKKAFNVLPVFTIYGIYIIFSLVCFYRELILCGIYYKSKKKCNNGTVNILLKYISNLIFKYFFVYKINTLPQYIPKNMSTIITINVVKIFYNDISIIYSTKPDKHIVKICLKNVFLNFFFLIIQTYCQNILKNIKKTYIYNINVLQLLYGYAWCW